MAALLIVGCTEDALPAPGEPETVLETLDAPFGTRVAIVERATDGSTVEYCIDYSDADGGGDLCRDATDFQEPLVGFFPSRTGETAVVAVDPYRRIGQLVGRAGDRELRSDSRDGLAAALFSNVLVESVRVIDKEGEMLLAIDSGITQPDD